MRILVLLFIAVSSLGFYIGSEKKTISVEKKKSKTGNNYTIIYQNTCEMEFVDKRPAEDDKSIQLCIAAAFTQLDNYKIDGAYLCKGKINNEKGVNHSVGGALKIVNGKASIFPTNKGKLITGKFLKDLSAQKASFFQQIQLVSNGNASSFKDKAHFQRRAIVIFKNGKTAIVECAESLLLANFSNDLVEFGAQNALYTDMGGWDEGFYIDPITKKKVTIGLMKTHTAYQSNWVVFRN
ncbi:MAG: hypothetical protein Q8M29_19585 [Bacteroidota bacterium]|nr:hypothetical protein [Bacteroidota bacterium]